MYRFAKKFEISPHQRHVSPNQAILRIVANADTERPRSPPSLSQSCRYDTANLPFAADLCYFLCMKTAWYGRIVFGASAVLFGVIALMWYDADTWQALRQIWRLPFGTIIGGCLMTAQIAGGIGMQL